ncbi:MAG: DNA-binding transcriptional regulator PaaX [Paracoccaceae bacterium]|jgi:DNA-binding transcriptional regulator PaaX
MAKKPAKTSTRPATKGDRLIRLLKSRSGHDIAALSGKLGWQHHSTRAALSRLGKAGYAIEKLPPGKQGGSRYRLSGTPSGAIQ